MMRLILFRSLFPIILAVTVTACSSRTPGAEDPAPSGATPTPASTDRPEPDNRDSVVADESGEGTAAVSPTPAGDPASGAPAEDDQASQDPEESGTDPASAEGAEGEGSADATANIRPENATEQAPAEYDVTLDTTKGAIRIHVTRAWAPNGADRFYNLVKLGYFNDVAFFRVIEGFMAQVGMHGAPEVNARWQEAQIADDPVTQSNTLGMVTFAARGQPNSRTTQFFINMGNNANLDQMRFAPFGRTRDMNIVRALHDGYGEGAPAGRGPSQGRVAAEGNAYLRRDFPELDYIRTATVAP